MSEAIPIPAPAIDLHSDTSVEHMGADEWALIQAAQGGCPDAFRTLIEAYQRRVHHFCFQYLRNQEDAVEATQDTFVRVHRALGRYSPRAKFSTWLFRIALNLCRDRARKSKRVSMNIEDFGDALPCGQAKPDEAVMYEADLGKLDRGLSQLPERLRVVIVLVCLDGLSHRESAKVLKCSERAIEGRLYRARQQLAEWWEKA